MSGPMTPEKKAVLVAYGKRAEERKREKRRTKNVAPLPLVPPGSAPRYFGYSRVSTQDQADNGTSLQRQEENMRKVWDLSFKDACDWFGVMRDEAVSGSIPIKERAEGKRLLLSVRKGDTVAFASLDRAFRNMADGINTLTELDKRGVTVIVLNLPGGAEGRPSPVNFSTPIGRLMMQLLMAFAEFERHTIMERTHAAIRAKMLVDPWKIGGPPYGMKRPWPKSKNFVPDPEHRAWVCAATKVAKELGLARHSIYLRQTLKQRGMFWYKRFGGLWLETSKPPMHMPPTTTLISWIRSEKRAQAKEAAGLYLHRRGCWRKKHTTTPTEAAAGVVNLEPAIEVVT